jgi:hypothetical protein
LLIGQVMRKGTLATLAEVGLIRNAVRRRDELPHEMRALMVLVLPQGLAHVPCAYDLPHERRTQNAKKHISVPLALSFWYLIHFLDLDRVRSRFWIWKGEVASLVWLELSREAQAKVSDWIRINWYD